eukprot:CAMPEP_0197033976 /NCGR_PEP_ID=MMETSP1384-20130603/12222_1 /TAXON_ID=29189 /ORGANISM="Ammonia sp." /LENGTH=386 /DNA_ID=CAMNT_0042463843 /DNA_START=33 /DNA_END=1193 /DNA_ORIENTATION=-
MSQADTEKKENQEKYMEVSMAPQPLSTEEMKAKRDQVMAERNKKLQERMAAMAQRRIKRSAVSSNAKQQKEAMQEFTKQFTATYDKIEDDIKAQETHDQFKELKMRAFKLEQYLADNASILPSYTFEAKNKMMSNLKAKINETQQRIAPKPKFTFSNKTKKSANSGSPTKPETDETKSPETDEQHKENETNDNSHSNGKGDILQKLGIAEHEEIVIENKKLETIYKANGSINGSDICLSNLVNCTVSICDHIGALRMNNIKHCTIITGPISSSLHVEHLENSTVNAIMRQCRIHYCKDSKFYIHVNSEPVIEHSDNVQFAPYNVRYKELTQDWKKCDVDQKLNQWNKVKDFNWFKQQQSPHWSIIPEAERSEVVNPVVEDDDDDEL